MIVQWMSGDVDNPQSHGSRVAGSFHIIDIARPTDQTVPGLTQFPVDLPQHAISVVEWEPDNTPWTGISDWHDV